MYQLPAESRIIDESTHALDTPPSNVNRRNNNSHLTSNLSIGSIHSANYRLSPPPSYYSSHLMRTVIQSEPKFLTNWCVNVKTIKLEEGDSSLVATLSGTLLENDRETISSENYDAGSLVILISKNIVKTNNGVYHLLGTIAQGYPNNLYRACLEAEGIPRTWKYVLTQFSGSPPDYNQRTASTTANDLTHSIGMGIQDLINSYRILRHMAMVADRRLKEHADTRRNVGFLRERFQKKVIKTLKSVNDQIITGLKLILQKD